MARVGLMIDVQKCTGCYNCFLACRDEYFDNDYPPYSAAQPLAGQFWMQLREIERGVYPKPRLDYIPTACQHCRQAPCMAAAADGAVFRRPDGIVLIDPVKAKGQEAIAKACPYRVIFWNAEKQIPQKCTLCAHRLDQGEKLPRCVESCPTGALVFGDLDDPASEIARLAGRGEALHAEFGTQPMVAYLGLPKRMVVGEVLLKDKPGECAPGVRVQLEGGGHNREAVTDAYGDFAFEGLAKQSAYRLSLFYPGYLPRQIEIVTQRDLNLGEIVLEPQR